MITMFTWCHENIQGYDFSGVIFVGKVCALLYATLHFLPIISVWDVHDCAESYLRKITTAFPFLFSDMGKVLVKLENIYGKSVFSWSAVLEWKYNIAALMYELAQCSVQKYISG